MLFVDFRSRSFKFPLSLYSALPNITFHYQLFTVVCPMTKENSGVGNGFLIRRDRWLLSEWRLYYAYIRRTFSDTSNYENDSWWLDIYRKIMMTIVTFDSWKAGQDDEKIILSGKNRILVDDRLVGEGFFDSETNSESVETILSSDHDDRTIEEVLMKSVTMMINCSISDFSSRSAGDGLVFRNQVTLYPFSRTSIPEMSPNP